MGIRRTAHCDVFGCTSTTLVEVGQLLPTGWSEMAQVVEAKVDPQLMAMEALYKDLSKDGPERSRDALEEVYTHIRAAAKPPLTLDAGLICDRHPLPVLDHSRQDEPAFMMRASG